MGGSGRSSSYMKHKAIDRARQLSHKVKHHLLIFRKELKDVYEDAQINIQVEIRGFDRFSDIFFDNLISDWIIQQKIKNALTNVLHIKSQVTSALKQLKQEIPIVEKEIDELALLREEKILGADN